MLGKSKQAQKLMGDLSSLEAKHARLGALAHAIENGKLDLNEMASFAVVFKASESLKHAKTVLAELQSDSKSEDAKQFDIESLINNLKSLEKYDSNLASVLKNLGSAYVVNNAVLKISFATQLIAQLQALGTLEDKNDDAILQDAIDKLSREYNLPLGKNLQSASLSETDMESTIDQFREEVEPTLNSAEKCAADAEKFFSLGNIPMAFDLYDQAIQKFDDTDTDHKNFTTLKRISIVDITKRIEFGRNAVIAKIIANTSLIDECVSYAERSVANEHYDEALRCFKDAITYYERALIYHTDLRSEITRKKTEAEHRIEDIKLYLTHKAEEIEDQIAEELQRADAWYDQACDALRESKLEIAIRLYHQTSDLYKQILGYQTPALKDETKNHCQVRLQEIDRMISILPKPTQKAPETKTALEQKSMTVSASVSGPAGESKASPSSKLTDSIFDIVLQYPVSPFPPETKECYDTIRETSNLPQDASTHYARGNAYKKLGEYYKKLNLQNFSQIFFDLTKIEFETAKNYSNDSNKPLPEERLDELNKFLNNPPVVTPVHKQTSSVLLNTRKKAQAILDSITQATPLTQPEWLVKKYHEAYKIKPDLAETYLKYANWLCQQNRYIEAYEFFCIALECEPHHAKASYSAGAILANLDLEFHKNGFIKLTQELQAKTVDFFKKSLAANKSSTSKLTDKEIETINTRLSDFATAEEKDASVIAASTPEVPTENIASSEPETAKTDIKADTGTTDSQQKSESIKEPISKIITKKSEGLEKWKGKDKNISAAKEAFQEALDLANDLSKKSLTKADRKYIETAISQIGQNLRKIEKELNTPVEIKEHPAKAAADVSTAPASSAKPREAAESKVIPTNEIIKLATAFKNMESEKIIDSIAILRPHLPEIANYLEQNSHVGDVLKLLKEKLTHLLAEQKEDLSTKTAQITSAFLAILVVKEYQQDLKGSKLGLHRVAGKAITSKSFGYLNSFLPESNEIFPSIIFDPAKKFAEELTKHEALKKMFEAPEKPATAVAAITPAAPATQPVMAAPVQYAATAPIQHPYARPIPYPGPYAGYQGAMFAAPSHQQFAYQTYGQGYPPAAPISYGFNRGPMPGAGAGAPQNYSGQQRGYRP